MMRSIAFLIILFLLTTSCSEGWNDTTIQVINNIEPFESDIADYNGSIYSAYIYCYKSDYSSENIDIGTLAPGDSSVVVVLDEKVTKAKVSFTLLPGSKIYKNMYWNFRYFDVVFHYLEEKEHHEIIVDENTMFSTKLFLEVDDQGTAYDDMIFISQ